MKRSKTTCESTFIPTHSHFKLNRRQFYHYSDTFGLQHSVLMVWATSLWLGVYLINTRIKTHCSRLPILCYSAQNPSTLQHTLLCPSQKGSYSLSLVSGSPSDNPKHSRVKPQKCLEQHVCTPDTLQHTYSHFVQPFLYIRWGRGSLTIEVTLNLEVSHTEPQHRQFVQATSDLLGERQQAGQVVQLHIQAVPVAFGRIGLHRWRFCTSKSQRRQECSVMLPAKFALLDNVPHVVEIPPSEYQWEFLVWGRFFISCNKLLQ